MALLIAIGIFSLVFGILFLFFPGVISKMAEWSNRMIARTDEFIVARKKPVGIFLILAGLFILASVLLR
jgi:hypothetical protein